MQSEFVPKLYTLLRQRIPGKKVFSDILSGAGAGIVALPLSYSLINHLFTSFF